MANWKKVIVSGSVAELSAVSASAFYVQNGQLLTSPANTIISGSFSGSFKGNGANLTNVALDQAITNGVGVTAFSYNGTGSATVAVSGSSGLTANQITKWTGDAFANTTLSDNGTVVSGASSIQLSGANSSLTGSFTGSFKGDGSALTGIVTTLALSGSTGAGTLSSGSIDLKTEGLRIYGSSNQIDTSFVDATNTLTIGLSNNVSITNDLTVGGNLTVNGDLTYLNVANLLVEDKFVLLNSGSANPDEGGIIIDEGSGTGHAFIYDAGDTRWGFNPSVAYNATTANTTAYAAAVIDIQNGAHADAAEYQKIGNFKVDNGDVFVWA
jgi:hypothetical protein